MAFILSGSRAGHKHFEDFVSYICLSLTLSHLLQLWEAQIIQEHVQTVNFEICLLILQSFYFQVTCKVLN